MGLLPRSSGDRAIPWAKFAGAGLELAVFTFAFALVGYAIDQWVDGSKLVGTAIAALVGFSLGLFRFIVIAAQVNRESPDSAVHADRFKNKKEP